MSARHGRRRAPARSANQVLAWLRDPAIQIGLLGGLTWLCYLHLTLSYPLPALVARYALTDFGKASQWSSWSLADFLVSIFGAFGLYAGACRLVARHSRDRRLPRLILAIGALLAITLLFMYPITAIDLFDYVFHSRVFAHYGQNPLVVPPNTFPHDPWLKYVTWLSQATPYGGLWVLLTAPGSWLAGDNLILNLYLMKATAIAAYLGGALLVAAILRRTQPAYRLTGTLLFAWNPLVLFETAGNGHNDMLMMVFALLAVYLLARKQWAWVLPALLAAVLIKYAMVLLVPPFALYCWQAQPGRPERLRYVGVTAALCLPLLAMVAWFYWVSPRGLARETDFYSLLAMPTLVFNYFKGTMGEKLARSITVAVSVAGYLPVYAYGLWRLLAGLTGARRLAALSTWLVAAYLVLACMQFQPWFAVWPIALGIWVDNRLTRRLLLVFTATVLASYAANFVWNWNLHSMRHMQVNVMFVAVIFAAPLVLGLGAIARDRARLWPFSPRWRPSIKRSQP